MAMPPFDATPPDTRRFRREASLFAITVGAASSRDKRPYEENYSRLEAAPTIQKFPKPIVLEFIPSLKM
jgi:hypothetical protein